MQGSTIVILVTHEPSKVNPAHPTDVASLELGRMLHNKGQEVRIFTPHNFVRLSETTRAQCHLIANREQFLMWREEQSLKVLNGLHLASDIYMQIAFGVSNHSAETVIC